MTERTRHNDGSLGFKDRPNLEGYLSGAWFSRLFFCWATPLLKRGATNPHSLDSLFDLLDADRSERTSEQFDQKLDQFKKAKRPVIQALLALHAGSVLKAIGLFCLHVIAQTASALLLRSLVNSYMLLAGGVITSDPILKLFPQDPTIACTLLAVCILISTIIMLLTVHHAFLILLLVSSRVKSQLTVAIYAKALRLSYEVKQTTPSGHIVNLMATDLNRLHWSIQFLYSPFAHPLQIVMVLAILQAMIGWATWVGFSAMLLMLCLSSLLARFNMSIRKRLLKVSDRRIGVINEILTHIRVIKLYGWERSFLEQVGALRAGEVAFLSKIALLLVGINTVFQSSPVVIAASIFSILALMGEIPPVADVLAMVSLFSVLRWSMATLPESIVQLMEASLAVQRMEAFFALPEYTALNGDQSLPRGAISFSKYSALWRSEHAALTELDLEIRPGELVCLVGKIGSAKSALILALLGELQRSSGSLSLNGSVAYVSQHPWIINDNILNNITLAQSFDRERYQSCLRSAELSQDLELMPSGDQTEIGERGINLSGGQKQRISLARAAYSERDIYLFDDPFSALDPAVAEKVFQGLVEGLLGSKTRVITTHRLEFTLRADRIVVMEQGRIVECGRPQELMGRSSRFRALQQSYNGAERSAATPRMPEEVERIGVTEQHAEQGLYAEEGEVLLGSSDEDAGKLVLEEERRTGSVAKAMYTRYLGAFAPGVLVALLPLVFLARDLLQVSTDGWVAWWAKGHFSGQTVFLLGYLALSLALIVTSFLRSFTVRLRGLQAGTRLHQELLRGVLRAPLRFFDTNPVGRILSRFSGDTEVVDQSIPGNIIELLASFTWLAVTLLIVLVVNPLLVVAVPLLLLVYYRYLVLFRPNSRECQRLDSITRSPIFARYSESLAGLTSVRAFRWSELFRSRLLSAVNANQRCFLNWVAVNRWLGVRLELIGALIVFGAALAPIYLPSLLGPAAAGIAVMYALGVVGALNWAVRMLVQFESNMNSVERIDYYSNVTGECWEGKQPPVSWPQRGAIEFKALEVRYRDDLEPALRGLSAEIRSGEKIGIVGRTGAGKSTLVLALTRLVEPSRGDILIDGVSILKLSLEPLRSAIAVIPQDPVMFLGNIRDNLDPFKQFNDDKIWEALRRTHIEAFLRGKQQGLADNVTEGGANFSSGQRQLICLARALLRNNQVIILDEATASVDAETDALVQQTIRQEFLGKTILTIAHRLSTIMDYDRLIVLEGGRLIEFDTVANLMAKPAGHFRQMVGRSGEALAQSLQ